MRAAAVPPVSATARTGGALALTGFVLCTVLYFVQYALRSAPGVMTQDLGHAFGLTAVGVGTLASSYFYTYTVFSLVAGAALDRFGARAPVPVGAVVLALGALLFALDGGGGAQIGRLLQGAGGAFALTGAVYVAATAMPASRLALAVGVAQGVGMLGAWAGQVLVSSALRSWGLPWQWVWIAAAGAAGIIALCMLPSLPRRPARISVGRTHPIGTGGAAGGGLADMIRPYRVIFANRQSWLCGLCAGCLFVPTAIGDMVWRVPYFTTGLGIDYRQAVLSASMVPLGWVIGSPLLGWISDRSGRRKPVILLGALMLFAAEAVILFAPVPIATWWAVNFVFGVASGAAMVPYSVMKEINPDAVKGSATGAMNLIVFSMSAFAAPVHGWILARSGVGALSARAFVHIGLVGLGAIGLAVVVALLLPETGSAAGPIARADAA